MKISSAFIISEHTSSPPVPVPVDPVPVTITMTSIRYDYYGHKYANVDWGVTYPEYGENIATWRSGGIQGATNRGEYWRTQGYDTIPCNVGGSNGTGTWVTFYFNSEGFYNGRHNVYDYMKYFGATCSFTVDVSGLTPGKYVFQLIHWFGYQDVFEDRVVRVDGAKNKVIKEGAYGVIEGTAYPEVVTYTGNGDLARGKVVKGIINYGFNVNTGDTMKVFEFGKEKEISFEDLWDWVYMTEGSSSVWANVSSSFNVTVYTAR